MSPTRSYQVDQLRGDILSNTMRLLHENPARLPEGFHGATVEPGVAMLVEPLNEHAFVFVPPNTVHQFASEPGNGADKLRQRIHAGLFFHSVVDSKRAASVRAAAGEDRVAAAMASRSPRP
jgi:hypothetical protein